MPYSHMKRSNDDVLHDMHRKSVPVVRLGLIAPTRQLYILCCHVSIIMQCLVTDYSNLSLTEVGVKKGCITQNILVERCKTRSVEEGGG